MPQYGSRGKTGPRGSYRSILNSFAYSDNITAVLCGEFLEVLRTPERRQGGGIGGDTAQGENREPETPEEIIARSVRRSQQKIRRVVNCNALYYMHTLTFATKDINYFEGEKPFTIVPIEEQKDRESVISRWKVFARKMRRYAEKKGLLFQYLTVIERHEGKRAKEDQTIKQGTYHIHFVSDRIWDKRLLQHKWGHGLCNYSDWTKGRKKQDLDTTDTLPPPDNPGAYMSKYMGKDGIKEERNKKRYWVSRNLRKPVPLQGADIAEVLKTGARQIFKRVSEITAGEYTGYVIQTSYKVSAAHYKNMYRHVNRTPEAERIKKAYRRAEYQETLKFQRELQREVYNENLHRETGQHVIERNIDRIYNANKEARKAVERFDDRYTGA